MVDSPTPEGGLWSRSQQEWPRLHACQDPHMWDQDRGCGDRGHRPACAVFSPCRLVLPLHRILHGGHGGSARVWGKGLHPRSLSAPPELRRGECRAQILSPPDARPSQRFQEVSVESRELELRCLSGEMTQKGHWQNSKEPDVERPLPFSCHEVQKGQKWRVPLKEWVRPTLTPDMDLPHTHTDPAQGPQRPYTET